MPLFLSIRVAEPWTAASIVAFVAIIALLAGLTLWLIARH